MSRSDLICNDPALQGIGFNPAQIAGFLRRHGLDIDMTPNATPSAPAAPEFPDWKIALAAHERLSAWQAAAALAGIDPHQSGYMGDDDRAEIARWESALSDSAGLTFEMDGDQRFPLAAFESWCEEKGVPYPLPRAARTTVPTTDPELREALDAARKVASAWEARATKLEAENADLKRAAEQAKAASDDLKGRGRTSALKIIAGLADKAKMWEMGSDRNKRLGVLADHMNKLGIGVDPKTLTGWLSDAKKEIPAKPPSSE